MFLSSVSAKLALPHEIVSLLYCEGFRSLQEL